MTKGYTTDELLKKLPKNYREIKYSKYIEIIKLIPDSKPEWMEDDDEYNAYIQYSILSILLDVPVIDLERLPATTIIPLLQAIQFMDVPLQPVKTDIQVKNMEELTYDEFVRYNKYIQNQWDNLPEILSMVIKSMTPSQISQLSIYDAMQVFFCLNKSTIKSLRHSQRFLGWRLMKQLMKEKVNKMLIILKLIKA